jgi:hypothetical protein
MAELLTYPRISERLSLLRKLIRTIKVFLLVFWRMARKSAIVAEKLETSVQNGWFPQTVGVGGWAGTEAA